MELDMKDGEILHSFLNINKETLRLSRQVLSKKTHLQFITLVKIVKLYLRKKRKIFCLDVEY